MAEVGTEMKPDEADVEGKSPPAQNHESNNLNDEQNDEVRKLNVTQGLAPLDLRVWPKGDQQPFFTSSVLGDKEGDGPLATDVAHTPMQEEITAMKRRVAEMEEEAAKLRELQATLEERQQSEAVDDKSDVDSRSIFVGNVDYSASPEDIQAHFQQCGTINRVTILLDKFTGQPKGYAYVEFTEPHLVASALVLNDSVLKGRNIKVNPKRTNVPGMSRGRGGRGRGGFGGRGFYGRGGYVPRGGYRGGFRGRARGGGYAPY